MGIDVEIGSALGARDYEIYRRRFSMPYIFAGIILMGAIALGMVFAFEFSYRYIINLSIFTLKETAVFGNSQISASDILDSAKLQGYIGINSVYSVLPHVVEKRIKTNFRYLEDMEIKRSVVRDPVKGIYGLLTIKVKERKPIALVASGRDAKSFIVTDADGIALEELKGSDNLGFPYEKMPVILGVDQAALKSGVLEESFKLGLNVVVNINTIPELVGKISYIDAREPDNIILYLESHDVSEINVRLARDRIREGLEDIVPVISKLTKERKETKYVDARFAGAVYCMGLEDSSKKGGEAVAQK